MKNTKNISRDIKALLLKSRPKLIAAATLATGLAALPVATEMAI